MAGRIIQVEERVPLLKGIPLSIQHTFAMFSASVLVPWLFGINAAIVLLMNGIGTLIFIVITKGKSPAYLGSSFAFISPTLLLISNPDFGYPYALGGFVVTGLIFCAVAILIKFAGTKWIDTVLPPAAMGPVVALIGLELAGTAAQNGGLVPSETYTGINPLFVVVFVVTIAVAVLGQVLFRGFAAAISILIAIVSGYLVAFFAGLVDFSGVMQAGLFAWPNFVFPRFSPEAIFIIIPASLVVISEHIGHQVVTSEIVGRDLLKDPGLHRTLFSDGVSTVLSGCFGSVPTTTYGENIGVMAITKVFSVRVIGGAAVFSILLAFFAPASALINSIPAPVMGGISFLLYGMIGASGIRLMVDRKVNYAKGRNLAMTALVFVVGLSGVYIRIGNVKLTGMCLATLTGIFLGGLFYVIDRLGIANDTDEPDHG
ncbi:uracil permease [Tannerella forsythia KS16]|uniref:Uracil permease n=1 Tax=Tannerella forsythia TaxID=28112 RepID=A0A1D3UJ47_TANFO|nr:uracil permease [Tannerella forsythia]KKY62541.1 uracil permease [Tannerella forsythia]OLQ19524.1 uracil permease [Tannerella forsythia]PDP69950.1 uracil permease [Tannerella forsythia]TPE17848.1 uracil permease [Tannerella forsythia]SCQ19484.1 Uracil permease [Tannerella forsythia]